MKRTIFAFWFIAFSSAAIVSAYSQAVPSGIQQVYTLRVGALGSYFQPDYRGEGIAQTTNWMYGPGAYADFRVNRWIQPEIEVRWLRFHRPLASIDENTYSAGERLPIREFHRFTPYGKLLAGFGTGDFLDGDALVLTYGGGVDYRLNRKFTLRVPDFEYQEWPVSNLTFRPYGFSAGVSYKIF